MSRQETSVAQTDSEESRVVFRVLLGQLLRERNMLDFDDLLLVGSSD